MESLEMGSEGEASPEASTALRMSSVNSCGGSADPSQGSRKPKATNTRIHPPLRTLSDFRGQ